MTPIDLDTLLAERAIARALHRFARAMDERDWSALERVLRADATADLGTGPLRGRDAIVAQMRSFLDACGPTQHLLGNLLVEVEGQRATSRCYVSDLHVGSGTRAQQTFSTLGEYHDVWRREGDDWWMIERKKLTRAMLGSLEVLGPGPPGWKQR